MADLSPAAKAILKAAYKATRNPKWQTNFYTSYAAAVLEAAADQVVPEEATPWNSTLTPMVSAVDVRARLLAIAAELRGQNQPSSEEP